MRKEFTEIREKNHSLYEQAVLEQKEIAEYYPPKLIIESTTRCNFRCTMCPLFGDDSKGYDFDQDLFDRKIVPLLPYANEIMLQGVGEPLLSKNFDYFYETAVDHGVRPIFITNGSQLDETKIRRFVKDGVKMSFSLDGISRETLSVFRPQADIDELFANLNLIGNISREYPNSGFTFFVASILSRFNIHEFPMLVDYAYKWNAQILLMDELVLLPNAPPSIRNGQLQREDIEKYSDLLELGKRKAKEYGIELVLPKRFGGTLSRLVIPEPFKPILGRKEREGNPYPSACFSPWKEIMVYANGDVRPCCYSPDVLGNLYHEDFDSIWNGEKFKSYRKTVNSFSPLLPCHLCASPSGINIGSPKYLHHVSSSSGQGMVSLSVREPGALEKVR